MYGVLEMLIWPPFKHQQAPALNSISLLKKEHCFANAFSCMSYSLTQCYRASGLLNAHYVLRNHHKNNLRSTLTLWRQRLSDKKIKQQRADYYFRDYKTKLTLPALLLLNKSQQCLARDKMSVRSLYSFERWPYKNLLKTRIQFVVSRYIIVEKLQICINKICITIALVLLDNSS